jgi:hypothetical protein
MRVPDAGASVQQLLDFAATYDAYEHFAAEPAQLQRLVGGVYDEIVTSLAVPDWVRVDLARAVLFYAYRADYFAGGYGPYEPMAVVVEHIRRLSGGWVIRRARPDSASSTQRQTVPTSATIGEFRDSWEYSDDHVYRWWYERRWEPGPALCFVGLNPATGDTDGKPRPTLNKVVGWARREGCAAVVVVNLFAYRSTDPANLFSAPVDIIGDRNDAVIEDQSKAARITLAAWGAHPLAQARAKDVIPLLKQPCCVGLTKRGAPAHPLYVPSSRPFQPFS